jgi:hypothetical protein
MKIVYSPKILFYTFNLVVTSFFDNFFKTIFNSPGINFSSSVVNGFNPKTFDEKSTFDKTELGWDKSSADRALLEGFKKNNKN